MQIGGNDNDKEETCNLRRMSKMSKMSNIGMKTMSLWIEMRRRMIRKIAMKKMLLMRRRMMDSLSRSVC